MPYFHTTDGLRLFYRDQGHGLPILCLPGLTRNGDDFSFIAPHLCDMRMITLDSRGRGNSQWAKDYTTYSILQETNDALALLDHLGIKRTTVLGTSRGGLIAMTMATLAKDRLIGVILNDIGPEINPEGISIIMGYLGLQPKFKTLEDAAKARKETMIGFDNIPSDRWMADARNTYIQTQNGLSLNYDPKLRDAIELLATQVQPDLWPFFDSLSKVPLALIWGMNSALLSQECVLQMQQRNNAMILGAVPDRGHVPFLDEPAALHAINQWKKRFDR